jgi:hypothetical protein
MQHPRPHWLLKLKLRDWRRAAQALALLALFSNVALLPALHFAAGGPGSSAPLPFSVEGSHHHGAGHGGQPADPGHQVCHFCRLLGVALPPPPTAVIELVAVLATPIWSIQATPILAPRLYREANPPRAPPRAV